MPGEFASSPDIQVMLVDPDVDPSTADHPDVVTITDSLGRMRQAHVVPLTVHRLNDLAGTNLEAAIETADFISS